MKPLCILLPIAAFCLAATSVQAQVQHQIRRAKITPSMQQTPQFQVSGPKDKRTTPLEWLEIEVELDLETIEKSGFIDSLDCTFYVALKDAVANKTLVLEDKFTFTEINARDKKAWLVAYVSPATLAKTLGKDRPMLGDVEAAAVNITGGGLRAPITEKTGGPDGWWTSAKVDRKNGLLLPKSKTVFAPLWGDRHPRTKDN